MRRFFSSTNRILFHPFSASPGEALAGFVFWSSLLWIIQTACCQYILPLDSIEAIVWGEQRQWGQMKSPPLSGWIAYAFARLSGYHDWGNYTAAQFCIVVGVSFTYRLAREFFDEAESAIAALLLFFLYYYMPPAMKFCSHDTQIALLPGIALFSWRAIRDDHWKDWLLLALVSAAAVLGKYAAVQQLLGSFAIMICFKIGRSRWKSVKPYAAAILFLLLLLPHILWLKQHDFLPILHLNQRVTQQIRWYDTLLAAGKMLFPYAVEGAVLAVIYFVSAWKKRECTPLRRDALRYSLLMTLVPGGIYLLISLSGHSIILEWYSYLASLTGITVVAAFPWKCTQKTFRFLLGAVWIYFVILLIAVTLDVMAKPRYRIHTRPAEIVALAEKAYGDTIPCVYGDRWLAGVIQNYSPHRPPAFVADDLCDWELGKEMMDKNGVLLVFDEPPDMQKLEKRFGRKIPPFTQKELSCKSQFGKKIEKEPPQIYFSWLPPGK